MRFDTKRLVNLVKRPKVHLTLLLILFIFAVFILVRHTDEKQKNVRTVQSAGKWFPRSNTSLDTMVSELLDKAEHVDVNGTVHALIVPHAGYQYSGIIAAYGFKNIGPAYDTVMVIGSSHYEELQGASIDTVTDYRTPLGDIELSPKIDDLLSLDIFSYNEKAHTKEHSIENELPFLQKKLSGFTLIPIVTGNVDPLQLADALLPIIDDKTLIVVSSDLSHYHDYDTAVALDSSCVRAVSELDLSSASHCEACGRIPILALMHIAESKGWHTIPVIYANSGDTTGSKEDGVVGYTSILYYGQEDPGTLSHDDKTLLLSYARETAEKHLKGDDLPELNLETLSSELTEKRGCFVTYNKHDTLRGCIGHIMPQEPLYECVKENAINAAVNDPRFPKISYAELLQVELEISVLTTPEKLSFTDPTDLLNKITPGTDGVILKKGFRQSTYLPQVWEQIPQKQIFLANLCVKAGMPNDCWKDPAIEVYTYQAEVFHD